MSSLSHCRFILLTLALSAMSIQAQLPSAPAASPTSGARPHTISPHEGLDRPCSTCHTTAGWKLVNFAHDLTGLPLAGAHAMATCTDCHRVRRFDEAVADCATCHVEPHQQALGADCEACHDEHIWALAPRFTHDATAFPLWGAHAATDCVQCHADERTFQFVELPGMCMDCHEAEFGRAPVAVHLTAGPDCQTCHTLDEWRGGHDPAWFEIRGGHHDPTCGQCHKRLPDYPSYTCADCHRFSLDEFEHRGVEVDDARCLDCHSRGGFHD